MHDIDSPELSDEELAQMKPALAIHKEKLLLAFNERRIIPATKLIDKVEIIHKDGSLFRISNGAIKEDGIWLYVFSVYHLPQVFLKKYLKSWRQLKAPQEGESYEELISDQ